MHYAVLGTYRIRLSGFGRRPCSTPYFNDNGRLVKASGFIPDATIVEGIPKKLEHNDIRWITPAEIPQYNFCSADTEILKRLIQPAELSG